MLSACLLLGVLIAFLVSDLCASKGKLAIMLGCSAVGIVMGILGGLAGAGMVRDLSTIVGWICGAALGFFPCLAPGLYMCTQGPKFRRLIEYASEVKEVGLTMFPLLDSQGKGVLERAALTRALKLQDRWTVRQILVLKHMLGDMPSVGHQIGSIPGPRGVPCPIFGITVDDLRTYPERRWAAWKVWLDYEV
jgi:hypothetical protein